MAKTIFVSEVETRKDSKQNDFNVLEVSTPSMFYTTGADGTKKAITQKPQSLRGVTGWLKSNLPSMNGKPDFEATLKEGQEVLGDIVSRKVEPYFIPDSPTTKPENKGTVEKDGKWGRMVSTARVAVFANSDDEESFDIEVAKAFKRKGYKLAESSAAQEVAAAEVVEDPIKLNAEKQAATAA